MDARRAQGLCHRSLLLLLAGLLLVLDVQAAPAAAKPPMNWLMLNLPPGSMPVEGRPTDGISDVALEMIMAAMPEYDHHVTVVNAARALVSLAEGAPACFASAALTPEREQLAYFTQTHLLPPLQIVVRADRARFLPLNGSGEVDARALFNSSKLQGVVVTQRSYTPALDELLRHRGPHSGVANALAADSGANVLRMLRMGRADYTIEYEFVLTYQARRYTDLGDPQQLITLPIAGADPVRIGVACPHTSWGREMILRVDAILTQASTHPRYRDSVNRWLSELGVQRHQRQQDEFFAQRTQLSPRARYPEWPTSK